jgi:hypothetical protein
MLVGVPFGIWLAFFYRYAWSDHFEVLGFPIPFLVFELEDGQWVEQSDPSVRQPVSGGLRVPSARVCRPLARLELRAWIADGAILIAESVPEESHSAWGTSTGILLSETKASGRPGVILP